MGLKFKYQFAAAAADNTISAKKFKTGEDNEPVSKKLKLTESRKISIIDYSSIQLPVAPFIEYLEKYSKSFVNQCLKSKSSPENTY